MRLTATTIAVFSLVTIGLGLVFLTLALLWASPTRAASLDEPAMQLAQSAYTSLSSLSASALSGSAFVLLGLRIRNAVKAGRK